MSPVLRSRNAGLQDAHEHDRGKGHVERSWGHTAPLGAHEEFGLRSRVVEGHRRLLGTLVWSHTFPSFQLGKYCLREVMERWERSGKYLRWRPRGAFTYHTDSRSSKSGTWSRRGPSTVAVGMLKGSFKLSAGSLPSMRLRSLE